MKQIYVDYEKFITHNNENIFKMVKTKNNRYYLVDLSTNNVIAQTKKEILKAIKKWGDENLKNRKV